MSVDLVQLIYQVVPRVIQFSAWLAIRMRVIDGLLTIDLSQDLSNGLANHSSDLFLHLITAAIVLVVMTTLDISDGRIAPPVAHHVGKGAKSLLILCHFFPFPNLMPLCIIISSQEKVEGQGTDHQNGEEKNDHYRVDT